MTARPAFKLTQRQVEDLLAVTPPGHVAQITIAFPKVDDVKSDGTTNPADLIDP